MFKSFRNFVVALMALMAVVPAASAQGLPDIPVDTAVRIGKLPNGLTYYIRHNETPKGQADFYIAQKVGSVLEEDNQRGLAHFLEHMCFNGTKSFPNNTLTSWLETKGVKFGADLNAYTSTDETVYNISNVPVGNTAVQDSCLIILHDWANDLLLDPEEIDKERGVIHEEWRLRMKGQMAILERALPLMYPDSRYAHRMPIGTMEVVDNFPYQALRDYYEAWYRPDLQGIVVVGDIDVDYIEGKIKEIFADVEMPDNAKERPTFEVPDTPGTIVIIDSDSEMQAPVGLLFFKTDVFPNDMKGNGLYLVQKYAETMVDMMLNQRLDDLANSPDATFVAASADFDNYLVSNSKDAFSVQIVAKGNEFEPALEEVYREVLRALRGGFTQGEYDRAKAEYLSRLERAYNTRDKRQNEAYVNEYVRHFIDNEPIPSIEDEFELMNSLAPMVDVNMINSLLPEVISEDNDNRVFLFMLPQNDSFSIPTEEGITAVLDKVDAEEIEPYEDAMKAEPLIPELPAPGKVVSITDDPQWDAKVLTLSNGVTVYVKPTDLKKDDIRFEAQAIGGTSVLPDDQLPIVMGASLVMGNHGLGDYTASDLTKYLQGKQAGVSFSLDDYSRSLSGSTTVKDLPTLMEMIYMTFIDYNICENDFKSVQSQMASQLKTLMSNPQIVFTKSIMDATYESDMKRFPSVESVNSADREGGIKLIQSNLANAADYTFYFVGDIDMDTLIPLLEQYIATLPADAAAVNKSFETVAALEPKPGKEVNDFTTKMVEPQIWVNVLISGEMPYTPANRILSSVAAQILSNRLLHKVREDMGATYHIGASGSMDRQNKVNTEMTIMSPLNPDQSKEALEQIDAIVNAMTQDVTDDELNPIKEYMVKSYTEQKEQNSGWIGAMSATALNGVDFFHDVENTINALTVADVQNFMKQLLDQGNYREVILSPAAE